MDAKTHHKIVALFVIGELFYIFMMTYILITTRSKWSKANQSSIDIMLLSSISILLIGGIHAYFKDRIEVKIDPYIEWFVFLLSFYLFALLSAMMPSNDIVVPEKLEKEHSLPK